MTASAPCPGCQGERVHVFEVSGMDCSAETTVIEKVLRSLPGVCSVRTSTLTRQATVVHTLEPGAICAAIASAGFTAREARREPPPPATAAWTTWAALAATAAGFAFSAAGSELAVGCFALGIVVGGVSIAMKGLRAARQGSLDMNALMSVAVVGAALIGQWSEAASTVVLFSLAQLLESRSLDRARRAIAGLVRLTPEAAVVRRDGGETRVAVADVAIGETIVIAPGERAPLDGLVQHGESEIDEAPLTGESIPVPKRAGDEVFAGSINGPGALDVRVTRHASETVLSRIIHRIEEAQASRAPSQGFVETFARIYTPLVFVGAIAAALVPPLLFGGDFKIWLYRALVLLVVACPCALVISTPVSIVSALTAASRRGVLIKGGAHLEAIGRIRGVLFDKTGTLTRGVPRVTEVVSIEPGGEARLLSLAASVEARSGHAIGRAILRCASERGLEWTAAEDVVALPGRGAKGTVAGQVVRVGSHRWFDEQALCDHRLDRALSVLEESGRTVMLVAAGEEGVIGHVAVADEIRADAAHAVADLQALGLHVAMLTGDNARTARVVADDLGIADRRAELLPEGKVEAVREIAHGHGALAMVGDGVNDAPALAVARVGIAVGTRASDAALETADIVLLHPDLRLVPETIRLSQAARRVVRQNVALSLGLKALVFGLAVSGYGTLWAAVGADMGASLLVIANGLRLLRHTPARS